MMLSISNRWAGVWCQLPGGGSINYCLLQIHMDRQKDRQTDRWHIVLTERQTDSWQIMTDRQMAYTDRHRDGIFWQTDGIMTDRQMTYTDRQTEGIYWQTDRQMAYTDRQTDCIYWQTDRQTDRWHILTDRKMTENMNCILLYSQIKIHLAA